MRALLFPLLILGACTPWTETRPSDGGTEAGAGSTDCGGRSSYTTTSSVDGIPCTVLHYCSGGVWHENGDDCFFKRPKCPSMAPGKGDACAGTLDCSWPCDGGASIRARCDGNAWAVLGCGEGASTTGNACTSTAECDPLGLGTAACSNDYDWPGFGTQLSPVCLGQECAPLTTGTAMQSCDGDRGLCVFAGLCMPVCRFDASGDPPKGCLGRTACHAREWTGVAGAGFCMGGCESEADCPAGIRCHPDWAICENVAASTKPLGESCTGSGGCLCLTAPGATAGQCTRVCRVGGVACPSGFACDPLLTNPIAKLPSGLAGLCQKVCASDADCVTGARCEQHGGLTEKTCTTRGLF